MGLSSQHIDLLKERLKERPEVEAAYLHGSAVKDTFRVDSDIDVAILSPAGTVFPLRQRLDCAALLESTLGRSVDLGLLSTGNLIYAKEVIAHGQELFTKNRFHSDLFIATCLSMYADLQQQRKKVIESYAP